MTRLEMRFFGGLQFSHDGTPLADFRSIKGQALLCYLAVTGHTHARASLAGLLWPESSEANARASLRKVLSEIRKTLPECLDTTRQEVTLDSDAAVWVDVNLFDTLAASRTDVHRLQQAMGLYQGDFLEGFFLPDAPAFDRWALIQRARLRQTALTVLNTLTAHFADRQEFEVAVSYSRQSLGIEPWREGEHRKLMRYLALSGQRSAALMQYETCRLILAEELGVEPGVETTALYEEIRDGDFGKLASPRLRPVRVLPTSESTTPPSLLGHSAAAPLKSASPLFVAREPELACLDELLAPALTGQGSVSFVIGESGSGKTALLQEFSRQVQQKHPHLVVAMGNCNAYIGIGDPYLPFREILEMLTGDVADRLTPEAPGHSDIRRIRDLMSVSVPALLEVGPSLIDTFVFGPSLVSRAKTVAAASTDWLVELHTWLAARAEHGAIQMNQAALFGQYTNVLQRVAQQHPLLLIVDDLQWADAGSIGLLFHLGRRLGNLPILLVGVYRPSDLAVGRDGQRHPLEAVVNEFQRQFGNSPIDLDRIAGREFVESLLERTPNRLGRGFREALHHQTSGQALFTVEMLRGLQERGDLVQDEAGRWIEGATIDWQTLPARIEGIVKERIARLPVTLQELLKVASVEGEKFTAETLARVQGLDERQVVRRLSDELDRQHRLVQSHKSQQTTPGGPRFSAYSFRHHLFQKYLYHSLDPAERVYLHKAVGQSLEELHSPQSGKIALQLARHFQTAGVVDKAIDYLHQAGERAAGFAANQEAAAHLTNALSLLASVPDSLERTHQELTLQIALGTALMKVKGFSAPEVKQAFDRARVLCLRVGDAPQITPIYQGLFRVYLLRGELDTSAEVAEQLLRRAEEQQDPLSLLPAYLAAGVTSLFRGELAQAQHYFEWCFRVDDPQQYQDQTLRFGQNPMVACVANTALALWYLGFPDQALKRSYEAVHLAQESASIYDVAYTSYCVSWIHQLRGEAQATQKHAEAAIELSGRYSFAYWLASASILRGWALIEQGQAEEGMVDLRQGLADMEASGAMLLMPYFLALLSESHARVGQVEKGLASLTNALTTVETTGERHYEPELYRLKGELLLRAKERALRDDLLPEECFSKAIEIARRQQARSLELRATISFSRLTTRQGKKDKARQMLADIRCLFSEGLDSADIREATTLLKQMP